MAVSAVEFRIDPRHPMQAAMRECIVEHGIVEENIIAVTKRNDWVTTLEGTPVGKSEAWVIVYRS